MKRRKGREQHAEDGVCRSHDDGKLRKGGDDKQSLQRFNHTLVPSLVSTNIQMKVSGPLLNKATAEATDDRDKTTDERWERVVGYRTVRGMTVRQCAKIECQLRLDSGDTRLPRAHCNAKESEDRYTSFSFLANFCTSRISYVPLCKNRRPMQTGEQLKPTLKDQLARDSMHIVWLWKPIP